jgi:hypothetical protein
VHPESPYRCRHAPCNLLVSGTCVADTLLALAPEHVGCLPGMRGTVAMCVRVAVPTAANVRGANPLGTSVRMRSGAMLGGSAETASACAGHWRTRQAGARAATAGPDAPGRRGFRHRVRSCPHGGCVRPGRPTAGRRLQRVAGVALARSVRGHGFRAAACWCTRRTGTARGNRATGVSRPGRCRARRRQECCGHRRPAASAYAPGRRTTGTGVLRRRPDVRIRMTAKRPGGSDRSCCRPVESRSATLRRRSDTPSAPHG